MGKLFQSRQGAAALVLLLILSAPWCVNALLDLQQSARVLQSLSVSTDANLTREFIDLTRYSSGHFQEKAGVCSFESVLTPEETMAEIQETLESKGWVSAPAESDVAASFFKNEGVYSWAYISCGVVNGTTVVVCNVI